jgi:4-hydroxybenzoate polyprenyltransferase/tetratricopeptide (TPR) repeat protein
MKGRLTSLIANLESSPLHPAWWVVTFVAVVATRNIIEGALGPSGSLGYSYFPAASALMVLDHFLFFYATLFLAFAIVLAGLTREAIGRVMKPLAVAWVVILLPPFVDFVLTHGEGAKITYITDLSSVMLRFFDPRVPLDRISFGQRIEVLIACALAFAYVRLKTRSWLRAALAFVAAYLIPAAVGILPMTYARLTNHAAAAAGNPELAYQLAFKSGGIVLEESRKLALVFLFTTCALGWAAFSMHARAKARAIVRGVRPLRAAHYVGLGVFGLVFGWAMLAPSGIVLSPAGDALGALGICLAMFLAFHGAVALNDLFDEEGDRLVRARRPLIAGALARPDVAREAAISMLAALVIALNVKYSTFLLVVLALAISFFYSAPPLRMKRIPIAATLLLGCASLIAALIGFSAFAEEKALYLFPPHLGWVIVLAFGLGFSAKDLKDVEGDRATGVMTLPVLLGERWGRIAIALFVFLGYLSVPLLLPFRSLALPAVLLGAWSGTMVLVWKRPRLDEILLAVSLAFTAAVGVTAVRNADLLTGTRALPARAMALEFRGRRAEALYDWQAAAAAYTPAAAVFPADAALQEKAGVSLARTGRSAEACAVLARALRLNPWSPTTWEYLTIARTQLGLMDEALVGLRAAIQRRVQPRIFLAMLGDHYVNRGDPAAGADAFAAALLLGQPDIPVRLRLADALMAAGDSKAARMQYVTAVERRPSSGDAHDAAGRFYHRTGELDRAIGELKAAVRLEPRNPAYWNNLGNAYRSKGLLADAMNALAEATRLAPRMLDPYYNRGEIFRVMGREEEARRQYLLALEIDPSFAPAREALAQEPRLNQ